MAARWRKEKSAREETSEELDTLKKEHRSSQQQLNRFKSKLNQLEQKLEDKERELQRAHDEIKQQRNQRAAANVRSRRTEVLNSRRTPAPKTTPKAAASKAAAVTTSTTPSSTTLPTRESELDPEIANIRSQVLDLLQKYDTAKVDRIDTIMEKFRGKEAVLLDKMRQRYESGASSTAPSSVDRSALARQRHEERMRRIREKKGGR